MKTTKQSIPWQLPFVAGALAVCLGCTNEPIYVPEANPTRVAEIRGGEGGDADEADAGSANVGTGWGVLKGQFVLSGGMPTLQPLSTGGKDSPVCAASVPDESLVVDSGSNGIANIVIYLRKASRIHPDSVEPPAEPLVFDQKDCLFLSHVTAIQVGRALHIKNSDPISHNTNISPPADTGINPLLAGNAEVQYTFGRRQNAPVAVTCNIHPWMKAYVIPREDPYFAVTSSDGTFEISNLPAGETLEFALWHERTGALEARSDWSKGRFEVEVPADGVEDLGRIEVASSTFE